jgi:hypothetical protein
LMAIGLTKIAYFLCKKIKLIKSIAYESLYVSKILHQK